MAQRPTVAFTGRADRATTLGKIPMPKPLKNHVLHAIVATLVGAVAIPPPGNAATTYGADEKSCAALENQTIGVGQITRSSFVRPPFIAEWPGGRAKERVDVPFCRVEASGSGGTGSDIRFEVWLPLRINWNGRFLGVGAGGSWGAVNQVDLGLGVNRGFASVATDNGHRGYRGYDIAWALGNPERIVDFGYRANHLAAEFGKALVTRFYAKPAMRAYFFGCSQGGHKGMTEAQRYPNDYDGIAIGAPVYSWVNEMTMQAWNFRALTQTPGSAINGSQMKLLSDAATRQCSGPDGLIADPRNCNFDPGTLQCSSAGDTMCLTALQVAAVRKMYAGPQTSAGARLNRGLTQGGELNWTRLWDLEHPDPMRSGSWFGVFRYMTFQDPNWDAAQLDFDRDPAFAKKKLGSILDPDSPDLDGFERRGGKLLVYHGWADDMVPAETSTDYHNAVVARLGRSKVDHFYRLFMVPGMAHCGGGAGADVLLRSSAHPGVKLDPDHDVLVAMQRWVEHGQAPHRLIASKINDRGEIERTRLLCPEPQAAHYRGFGEATDAGNWDCVAPAH
jgi:feruloyl esterase